MLAAVSAFVQGATFIFPSDKSFIYALCSEGAPWCLASVMLLSELLGVSLPDRLAAPARGAPPIC